MNEPRRIWWPLPGKLCLLERPGGGGRSHRPERRAEEIEYLVQSGVRLVVSTMKTRHNLTDYEDAGMEWVHVPVESCEEGAEALETVLKVLRKETRKRGAVAVHGNRQTDFVAAVGASWMRDIKNADAGWMLEEAARAGLRATPATCVLLGVPWDAKRFEPVVLRARPRPAAIAEAASA